MKNRLRLLLPLLLGPWLGLAQTVDSGSDGRDGAFNPTRNTVVDMADHPDGIYQYTSVNIPAGVTVSFIPNAGNSPVTWLVQSNVVINGMINMSGQPQAGGSGGVGGPGGWPGGRGGSNPSPGQGPGGGGASAATDNFAATGGNYGTLATGPAGGIVAAIYGNSFLLPLLGGSGGGGIGVPVGNNPGGGGGGGAILIASSSYIQLNGMIAATGGGVVGYWGPGGSGGVSGLLRQLLQVLVV